MPAADARRTQQERDGRAMEDKMLDRDLRRLVEEALEWEPSLNAANIGVAVDAGIVILSGHVTHYAEKMTAERIVKRVKAVRGLVSQIEVRPDAAGSDEDLAERAANLVEWDIAVPKGAVKVGVSKGLVILTGEVPWNFQRVSAENAVRRLAGITGVMNMVTVKPRVSLPDLKSRIEQALERQADVDARAVSVSVDGDKVTLEGRVKAWFERELVEKAAWSAPGVRQVEDHVRIG